MYHLVPQPLTVAVEVVQVVAVQVVVQVAVDQAAVPAAVEDMVTNGTS